MVTDGARLYLTEGSADAPAIVQVSVNGGETARIPVPLELPALLDFRVSLGVARFRFRRPSQRAAIVGCSCARRNSAPRWRGVSLGCLLVAGGRELALVTGADLYLAKNDGGNARLLAKLPGRGWQPGWSPDGQRLRLTVFDVPASTCSLWEVSREGTGLHRLLQGWRAGYPAEDGPVERIMLFDFKTGAWTELAQGSGLARGSSDSQYVITCASERSLP